MTTGASERAGLFDAAQNDGDSDSTAAISTAATSTAAAATPDR